MCVPTTTVSLGALAIGLAADSSRVLCDRGNRLGRHADTEIKEHDFFCGIDWTKLHQRGSFRRYGPNLTAILTTAPPSGSPPPNLHIPQFTYSALAAANLEPRTTPEHQDSGEEVENAETEQFAQPFAFSALFQSSKFSPGLSVQRGTPTPKRLLPAVTYALDTFVGFSWGPRLNAFNPPEIPTNFDPDATPRPALHRQPADLSPLPALPLQATDALPLPPSHLGAHAFHTPVRTGTPTTPHGHRVSIPRTGTGRRMQGQRVVSDREAMQQLVDCVGMSARKKVLESGKKPMHLRTVSGRFAPKKDIKRFVPISQPLVIDTGKKGDMSTTTSDSDSQPPSPTPRPGSAMSRKSAWGGSTPSLMVGRSTPTLTFSATETSRGIGGGSATRSGAGPVTLLASTNSSKPPASYDQKLRDVEWRHSQLLDQLAALEKDIETITLRLRSHN